jgi:CHAD domain-containing protein
MSDRIWNVFAYELLAKRAAVLRKLIAGSRPADAEYIHDVRVASRRLKETLRVFGASIEPAKAREWTKTIKTMLTALSNARDAQVQLGILQEFIGRHPALAKDPGLTQLAADLTKHHCKLDRKACKVIKTFEKAGVLREMSRFLKEKARSNEDGYGKPQASQLHMRIIPILARRMADVQHYSRFAGRPQCQKELHQLRLCIKKLRYTLELFAPLYGGALDESIETAAALQQALGNMHDSTVWLDHLTAEIPKQAPAKGLRSFYKTQKTAQRNYYKKFLKLWTKAGKQKAWTKMQQTIDAKQNNMDEK